MAFKRRYGLSHDKLPYALSTQHPRCRTCTAEIRTISHGEHDTSTYLRSAGYLSAAPDHQRVNLVSLEEARKTQTVFRDEALVGSLYDLLNFMPGLREVRMQDGPYGGTLKVDVLMRESVSDGTTPTECDACAGTRSKNGRWAANWGREDYLDM
ncbi:hypothetical protein DOTSEDRAFT_158858 [Dothistroma septosporum NZE10]|uniref:Uncharacterized protein n=1 Tax=Dothistroma septosporum (strain NZE10 / CBS 128990) TaxID=675120 RepID=N1PCF5_DOTSN|nr:hypothetical protein DOTSEDRAFT_158858 [Dothistroma septosporum NZE10]